MDGVITNTMPDHFRAWKTVLEREGVHVTPYDIYCREGQRGMRSVQELFQEKKKPYTVPKAREVLHAKEELFKKMVKRRFIPGARSFIKYLHKSRFKLALVTGTSRRELHQILPDSLYDLFDVVVTGNDVKHGKPHPEPYLLALRKLKVSHRQAVVIENAPFGIQSAKAAGLKCLAIETSLPKEYLQQADYVFADLRELRCKIKLISIGQAKT